MGSKIFILTTFALALSQSPAFGADFETICSNPSLSQAQQSTVLLILEKTGLPELISTENCKKAQLTLRNIKKLELAPTKFSEDRRSSFSWRTLNQITDLSPVGALTDLEELTLAVTTSDWSALANLKNLRSLRIGFYHGNFMDAKPVGPTNIGPIGKMTGLKSLTLSGLYEDSDMDISMLANLTGLESLSLHIRLQNIEPLQSLEKLKNLVIEPGYSNTKTISLAPLRRLNSLQTLKVTYATNSLDGIEALVNLEELKIQGTLSTNLSAVKDLVNLRQLDLSSSQGFTELNNLSSLEKLESLAVRFQKLRSVTGISKLPNLRDLDLQENQIEDAELLAQLPKLKSLNLAGNKIKHSEKLSGFKNLLKGNFSGNQLIDLKPLTRLVNLEELDLASNPLVDITPLGRMKKLRDLRFSGTDLCDFNPLVGLLDLETLSPGFNCKSDSLEALRPLRAAHVNSSGKVIRLEVYNVGQPDWWNP